VGLVPYINTSQQYESENMKSDNTVTLMQEELSTATEATKQMLLQKYGMIPPKLTKLETFLIQYESSGIPMRLVGPGVK